MPSAVWGCRLRVLLRCVPRRPRPTILVGLTQLCRGGVQVLGERSRPAACISLDGGQLELGEASMCQYTGSPKASVVQDRLGRCRRRLSFSTGLC